MNACLEWRSKWHKRYCILPTHCNVVIALQPTTGIQNRPLPPVPGPIRASTLPPPSPSAQKRRGVPLMGTLAKMQHNMVQSQIAAPVVRSFAVKERKGRPLNKNRLSTLPLLTPQKIDLPPQPQPKEEKCERLEKTTEGASTWPPLRRARSFFRKRRESSPSLSGASSTHSRTKKRFSDILKKKQEETSSPEMLIDGLSKFKLMKLCQSKWMVKSRPDGTRYLVRRREVEQNEESVPVTRQKQREDKTQLVTMLVV
ncbi:hypothetical protein Ciccas_003292 [Cichlidogyrus casuarinus]|uniref:Uncharacterized protein n=1 Tax=Cichlidogyrus casuarinus TaxID=1844966 RepID=A0ABD2QF72_9PLAT